MNSMAPEGFPIINPATGEMIRVHPCIDAASAAKKIDAAHAAWKAWRRLHIDQRSEVLSHAAALLRERSDVLAARCTEEMGKPITEAVAEIEKCAWVCEFYAEHAAGMLADQRFSIEHADVRIVCRPLGVIYAIMPWNFPFWQVFRAAAPGLMAGNAMILKHAPTTLGCGADITTIFQDAGAPNGLFQDLPIDLPDSPAIIAHRHVRGVTLTGSDRAGRADPGMPVGAARAHPLSRGVLAGVLRTLFRCGHHARCTAPRAVRDVQSEGRAAGAFHPARDARGSRSAAALDTARRGLPACV